MKHATGDGRPLGYRKSPMRSPAEAAAAQLFGQQDDITVLTLMFAPVAELQV